MLTSLLSPAAPRAMTIDYGYDSRGNVVTRSLNGEETIFDYDALDRLRGESGPAKTQTFARDANGNRRADGQGDYSLTPGSNRVATTPAGIVEIDPAGYRLEDPRHRYTWNAAGELASVRAGAVHKLAPDTPIASYVYDYRHRRVLKTTADMTTVFHHAPDGRLLAETRSTGEPLRTYVWLEGKPVAVIEHEALTGSAERTLYLETDALGTPRSATDDSGREVWRWTGDAYGAMQPDEDVDGDGVPTVINLRFPGQYYDAETGMHENWHRYYVPWEGRYLNSDPVGLGGGLNTYAYAYNNSLKYADPLGLDVLWKGTIGLGGGTAGFGGLGGIFELTSECKCGQIVTVRGFASLLTIGAGVSLGGSGGLSGSGGALALIARGSDCPEPSDFNGLAQYGGITVATPIGGATFFPSLSLGRAQLEPKLVDGPSFGSDIGITFGLGASAVNAIATEIKPCCDGKN